MKTVGVIPARYASSRFPGKPLADINGKPMIWWVYQRAASAKKLNDLVVATDDERIEKVCRQFGMAVIMTSTQHLTAANRLFECAQKMDGDFFVSVNGDEPLIEHEHINLAVPKAIDMSEACGVNLITPIRDPAELMDPANIKVVFNNQKEATYLSRAPIPFPYKSLNFSYYKHIGIIGYNRKMLELYGTSSPGFFESIEGIDTLRFIDYGKKLFLHIVEDAQSLSVDTPKDIERIKSMLIEKTTQKGMENE